MLNKRVVDNSKVHGNKMLETLDTYTHTHTHSVYTGSLGMLELIT